MTRRITIARDGTVKLRGAATRWQTFRDEEHGWSVIDPRDRTAVCGPLFEARAYLESLTDEELRGEADSVSPMSDKPACGPDPAECEQQPQHTEIVLRDWSVDD